MACLFNTSSYPRVEAHARCVEHVFRSLHYAVKRTLLRSEQDTSVRKGSLSSAGQAQTALAGSEPLNHPARHQATSESRLKEICFVELQLPCTRSGYACDLILT